MVEAERGYMVQFRNPGREWCDALPGAVAEDQASHILKDCEQASPIFNPGVDVEWRVTAEAQGEIAQYPGYQDQAEYEAVTQALEEASKELTGQPRFDDHESGPGGESV
jgi:hypothetical protein